MKRVAVWLLLPLWLTLLTHKTLAHAQGESWSVLALDGTRARITYAMAASDLAGMLPAQAHAVDFRSRWPERIATGFLVTSAGIPCPASDLDLRQTSQVVETRWVVSCPTVGPLAVHNNALFDLMPQHIHISRAVDARGVTREKLFTGTDRHWQISLDTDLLTTLTDYFQLGVFHIVTGYDHLAFLLALLLLSPRFTTLVLMITGFTVGHSITLALAVLGYARVDSGAVEALIGLTIALVAAEVVAVRHQLTMALSATTSILLLLMVCLAASGITSSGPGPITLSGILLFCVCYLGLSRRDDLANVVNPGLTLLFGMIHGFGFAGILLALELSTVQLVPALLGFNLGVEAGQLALICLALGMALLVRRRVPAPWYLTDATAGILCGVGLYLFITRSLAA